MANITFRPGDPAYDALTPAEKQSDWLSDNYIQQKYKGTVLRNTVTSYSFKPIQTNYKPTDVIPTISQIKQNDMVRTYFPTAYSQLPSTSDFSKYNSSVSDYNSLRQKYVDQYALNPASVDVNAFNALKSPVRPTGIASTTGTQYVLLDRSIPLHENNAFFQTGSNYASNEIKKSASQLANKNFDFNQAVVNAAKGETSLKPTSGTTYMRTNIARLGLDPKTSEFVGLTPSRMSSGVTTSQNYIKAPSKPSVSSISSGDSAVILTTTTENRGKFGQTPIQTRQQSSQSGLKTILDWGSGLFVPSKVSTQQASSKITPEGYVNVAQIFSNPIGFIGKVGLGVTLGATYNALKGTSTKSSLSTSVTNTSPIQVKTYGSGGVTSQFTPYTPDNTAIYNPDNSTPSKTASKTGSATDLAKNKLFIGPGSTFYNAAKAGTLKNAEYIPATTSIQKIKSEVSIQPTSTIRPTSDIAVQTTYAIPQLKQSSASTQSAYTIPQLKSASPNIQKTKELTIIDYTNAPAGSIQNMLDSSSIPKDVTYKVVKNNPSVPNYQTIKQADGTSIMQPIQANTLLYFGANNPEEQLIYGVKTSGGYAAGMAGNAVRGGRAGYIATSDLQKNNPSNYGELTSLRLYHEGLEITGNQADNMNTNLGYQIAMGNKPKTESSYYNYLATGKVTRKQSTSKKQKLYKVTKPVKRVIQTNHKKATIKTPKLLKTPRVTQRPIKPIATMAKVNTKVITGGMIHGFGNQKPMISKQSTKAVKIQKPKSKGIINYFY